MDNNHTDIQIPYPEAAERQLVIRVGACRLRITPRHSRLLGERNL